MTRITRKAIIMIALVVCLPTISCTLGKRQKIESFDIEYFQEKKALEFEFYMLINCSPEIVFEFFRDIDKHPLGKDSPVLLLEKITDGPPRVGTQYIEIVKMLPFIKGRFLSEITHYEPNNRLELMWMGGGMRGYLIYTFKSFENKTKLYQRELIKPIGILNLFSSYIKRKFYNNASMRLENIRTILEAINSQSNDVNSQ